MAVVVRDARAGDGDEAHHQLDAAFGPAPHRPEPDDQDRHEQRVDEQQGRKSSGKREDLEARAEQGQAREEHQGGRSAPRDVQPERLPEGRRVQRGETTSLAAAWAIDGSKEIGHRRTRQRTRVTATMGASRASRSERRTEVSSSASRRARRNAEPMAMSPAKSFAATKTLGPRIGPFSRVGQRGRRVDSTVALQPSETKAVA